MASSSAEARCALFHEGGDAFGVVRGVSQLALIVALDIELLLERAPTGAVDGILRAREAASGRLRKLLAS